MPRFAANLSMMFTELPFMERFGAAADAGFKGVEFLFPYEYDAAGIRAALDKAGLTQALFNISAGRFNAGERGFAAIPDAQPLFRRHLAQALEYAAIIEPDHIHIMSGITDDAEARETLIENLRLAATQAPQQSFVIEPINSRDMPGYFLKSVEQAADIISTINAPNLGLQLDLYHCQIMHGDLITRIRALAPITRHIQIAGVPDRHEPDGGELDMHRLMDVLDATGYTGWVGCEYHPEDTTPGGLGWFGRYRNSQ